MASSSLVGLRDNHRSEFNGSRKENDERRHDTVIILSQDADFSHHEGCLLLCAAAWTWDGSGDWAARTLPEICVSDAPLHNRT